MSNQSQSLLANLDVLPLRPGTMVKEFGPTVLIAPHPDDETLGCGGAIAHLSQDCLVQVLVISDGTLSLRALGAILPWHSERCGKLKRDQR